MKDETAVAKSQLYKEIAVDELADIMSRYADPDEVLSKAGISRSELRKMEADEEISSALETRLNAVLATPWRIEPGQNNAVYDFVIENLEDRYEQLVRAIWSAVPYGYSVVEAVYKTEDNAVMWDRLTEKPFEWFEPQRDGTLKYYPSNGAAGVDGEVVDTQYKFFLARRSPSYKNPYGRAILSQLYRPWVLRTKGLEFWALYLERHGSPLMVGKTAGNVQALASAMAKALQSAVLAIPEDDEVKAVSVSGGGDAFQLFERAMVKSVQKVILGQTLTTDTDGKGSYAAAKVHNMVREDRRLSDIRLVSGTIQRMINALVRLNYPSSVEPPKFVMEDGAGLELERAERDAKLVNAGIVNLSNDYLLRVYGYEPEDLMPSGVKPADMNAYSMGIERFVDLGVEIPERFIKDLFGIPDPARGDDVLEKQEPVEPGQSASMSIDVTEDVMLSADKDSGDKSRFTPEQVALEKLAENAMDEAGSPVDTKKVVAAIKASSSPEDLAERLAKLYDGGRNKAFDEVLERALFAADVMGYVHMQEWEPDDA